MIVPAILAIQFGENHRIHIKIIAMELSLLTIG